MTTIRSSVKPVNRVALYHICANMRDVDKREIYPLLPHDNPLLLAHQTMHACNMGRAKCIWVNGIPAAVCGVHPEFGHMAYRVFAFGTDQWKSAAFLVMRELRKIARSVIKDHGTMRMHADSHADHEEAHKWMERMNGKCESVMPYYGKNGETYHRYVWLRDDVEWMNSPEWQPYSTKEIPCADQAAKQPRLPLIAAQ